MMARALLLLLLLTGWPCGTALAEDTTPAVSATFLKKLSEAQTALEQQKRDTARALLQALTEETDNSAYENGLAWSTLGYLHYHAGDLKQAARAYEKALTFRLPHPLAQDIRKTLGQVYLSDDNCGQAVTVLQHWLSSKPDNAEDVHVWTGQCLYQLGRYKQAAQHLDAAIRAVQARGQRPKEAWLSLQQAALAQVDDAKERIDTLKMLLRWYPKPEYWLALAGTFSQLNQMDDYLASLAVAERRNLLGNELQYLSLASVYYNQNVPYRAARIIEEGMRKKIVRANEKNLRFLASCYTLAQEFEKALVPLRQAAALASSGEVDALLGNVLFQLARWQEAASALETALDKGDIKQRDTLWLMLGQSYLNLHQFERALYAFQQVLPDETRGHQAQQWINYTEFERRRYEELGLIDASES